MERDFMGLTVKQEIPDEIIDAAPVRSLAMQWSFSNKGSAPPQRFSFHGAHEQSPRTGFDSLASTGLVTITTSETFENDHKSYTSSMQKDDVLEKQGGVRYSVTNYPVNHLEGRNVHRPVTNHSNLPVSPAASSAKHQSFVATSGHNQIGSVMTNPIPAMPSGSPVLGTTDLRSGAKTSGAPAQLTIFYNGSVCVYDSISSEKAQAIMLLAGNGPPATPTAVPSTTPTTMPSATPVPASRPMTAVHEGFVVSQPYGAMPIRSSHVPMNSIAVSHNAGRCGTNNDTNAFRPTGFLGSCSNNAEPPKIVTPIRSVPATFIPSDTVPQFRKKSLARFLEKRKERVISASPYGEKQTPDCSTPGGGTTSLSVNSSGSCPAQAAS